MMVCWMAPQSRLSPKLRGKFMHWLDVLGRWSLTDFFSCFMLMVAFSLHISPKSDYIPPDFLDVNIIVQTKIGFYLFVVGIIFSLIITHIILLYHNKETAIEKGFASGPAGCSLWSRTFQYPYTEVKNIMVSSRRKITLPIITDDNKEITVPEVTDKEKIN